jgi:hypothetical protein
VIDLLAHRLLSVAWAKKKGLCGGRGPHGGEVPGLAAGHVGFWGRPMDICSQGAMMAAAERALWSGEHQMSKREPTELSPQKRIELQFQEDFRIDPQRAYEKHGLTPILKRGVAVGFVLWLGFLIWTALHH